MISAAMINRAFMPLLSDDVPRPILPYAADERKLSEGQR